MLLYILLCLIPFVMSAAQNVPKNVAKEALVATQSVPPTEERDLSNLCIDDETFAEILHYDPKLALRIIEAGKNSPNHSK